MKSGREREATLAHYFIVRGLEMDNHEYANDVCVSVACYHFGLVVSRLHISLFMFGPSPHLALLHGAVMELPASTGRCSSF